MHKFIRDKYVDMNIEECMHTYQLHYINIEYTYQKISLTHEIYAYSQAAKASNHMSLKEKDQLAAASTAPGNLGMIFIFLYLFM